MKISGLWVEGFKVRVLGVAARRRGGAKVPLVRSKVAWIDPPPPEVSDSLKSKYPELKVLKPAAKTRPWTHNLIS